MVITFPIAQQVTAKSVIICLRLNMIPLFEDLLFEGFTEKKGSQLYSTVWTIIKYTCWYFDENTSWYVDETATGYWSIKYSLFGLKGLLVKYLVIINFYDAKPGKQWVNFTDDAQLYPIFR